jgi:transposase-like protein
MIYFGGRTPSKHPNCTGCTGYSPTGNGQAKTHDSAHTVALGTLNADKPEEQSITIRQSKYQDNLLDQDCRNIKRRTWTMLGFSSFRRAQILLAGIELVNMLRKGQFQHPIGDGLSSAQQSFCWLPLRC